MEGQTPAPPPDAPQGVKRLAPGERAHENTDASASLVLGVMLAMIFSGVIIHFLLFGFLQTMKNYFGSNELKYWGVVDSKPINIHEPPPPNLEINNDGELSQVIADGKAHLSNYEWLDKKNGTLRIPISRAMELIAEKEPSK